MGHRGGGRGNHVAASEERRLPSLVALELMQAGKGWFWSEWLGTAGFLGRL